MRNRFFVYGRKCSFHYLRRFFIHRTGNGDGIKANCEWERMKFQRIYVQIEIDIGARYLNLYSIFDKTELGESVALLFRVGIFPFIAVGGNLKELLASVKFIYKLIGHRDDLIFANKIFSYLFLI